MSETQTIFNPPVYPLQPEVPPFQTVSGVLNEVGQDLFNTAPINGQPPIQDFWLTRQEYVAGVVPTGSNHICTCDVLKLTGNTTNPDGTGWNRQPLMWPRSFVVQSSQFAKPKVTLSFWAIKPLATGGKIRVQYTPDASFDITQAGLDFTATGPVLTTADAPPIAADSRQRCYLWEWDLKAKNIFSLTFEGNLPLAAMPTNTGLPKVNKFESYGVSEQSGLPYFTTTFGTVSLYWQNAYIPGSIYPDSFTIYIFKSLAGSEFYVQTGPRCGSRTYIR